MKNNLIPTPKRKTSIPVNETPNYPETYENIFNENPLAMPDRTEITLQNSTKKQKIQEMELELDKLKVNNYHVEHENDDFDNNETDNKIILENEEDNINTGQVISVKDGVAFVTGLKLFKLGRW